MHGPSRHVLLVTDAYPPEIRSCSTLMHELAHGLSDRGYDVTVLTTYPVYNLTDDQRDRFSAVLPNLVVDEHGIRVIRAPTPPLHNVGSIVKGLSQITLPVIFSLAGSLLPRLDSIIVYSPPLTLGLAAAMLKARFGARVILNVQDLFPQNAVDLGVLNDPTLIRMFEWIETASYRCADILTCHSEGNIEWLRNHPAMRDRSDDVRLVYNWVDVNAYQEAEPDPTIRSRLGLDDRFVFFFGGVMGFGQDLDTVIEGARRLKDRSEISFLLVGDGVERERLEKRATGLDNVVFHPFISQDEYIRWLRIMDAGMVTLRSDMKTPVVPSKILGFMAAGIPFVAMLNHESDGRGITLEAGCGKLTDPGDPEAFASACMDMAANRKDAVDMGTRGLEYCRTNFSREACIDKYDRILQSFP